MKQPATMEICTTWVCTNKCGYCPQDTLANAVRQKGITPTQKMDLTTYKTCINKLPGGAWIDFSAFVEPFLNKNCTEMILYADNTNHPIRLFTTLAGMTREDIDKIKHINFIRISLHLPDNLGIMKINVDENYCDVFKYLLDSWQGGDAMCFGPLHSKLIPIVDKYRLKVSIKQLTHKHLGTRANNVKSSKHLELEKIPVKKGRIYCAPILKKNGGPRGRFNHNILLPNGDVVLCCSDYGLNQKLGNLLINEYEDLFSSNGYKRIMQGLEDESIELLCRKCEHAISLK